MGAISKKKQTKKPSSKTTGLDKTMTFFLKELVLIRLTGNWFLLHVSGREHKESSLQWHSRQLILNSKSKTW